MNMLVEPPPPEADELRPDDQYEEKALIKRALGDAHNLMESVSEEKPNGSLASIEDNVRAGVHQAFLNSQTGSAHIQVVIEEAVLGKKDKDKEKYPPGKEAA